MKGQGKTMTNTPEQSGLSRRSFLKGASISAVGLFGAATLGGCSPKSANDDTIDSTGKSIGNTAQNAEGPWDEETDIVVVGSGAAGVTAALAAVNAGAKVVMVDKGETLGGISSVCEQYCAFDSSLHTPQNFSDVTDSAATMLEDALRASGGTADRTLAKIYCDQSPDMIDWMIENGCTFKPNLRVSDGRHGQGKYILTAPGELTSKFTAAFEAAGGKTMTKTPLTALARDESGRVVGAVCSDGKMRIRANKGVIICTGPWSDDQTMAPRHIPQVPEIPTKCAETLAAFGMPYGPYTGEGIRAAQHAGAATRHMEYIMFDPYYSIPSLMEQKIAPAGLTRAVNQILVTPEGNRFTDEGKSRGAIALDILDLPTNTYYPVIDKRHLPDPTGSIKFEEKVLDSWVEKGFMAKGNTLEELTASMEKNLGVPAATAQATIERYNEFCATGVDQDFGKDSHHMTPLDQPPFYAGPAETCRSLYTHGGLEIDENAQVKDVDGVPIPGLYAAGLCTGGPLGAITISGNWQISSMVFGRIAGTHAAGTANA